MTAEVTSADVTIEKPASVSATASGIGSWEDAFKIEYFNDDYSKKMDSVTANIGSSLYAMVTFTISGDNLNLNWFVDDCTVIENTFQVKIVKNTCFAEVVGSQFIGTSTNDPAKDKIVKTSTKFKSH